MNLSIRSLFWEAEARAIVDDISLDVSAKHLVGLLGPNGSGKSTLLRMIYRLLRPVAGTVLLDDQDVWRMSARDTAQRMAVLPQENSGDFDFSVHEIVIMGRTPHKRMFDGDTKNDHRLVDQALIRVGAADLGRRRFQSLSGGEKQRVLLARALVQQAAIMVLDEPTNHLDIRYQFEIMTLIRDLGVTTIAALHDLNLAAHYCDRLHLIDSGRLIASGTPAEVLTPALIHQVYGVRAEVELTTRSGKPQVTFLPDEGCKPTSAYSG
ncbi:MAG: ABC transporter ATP-binding protein [Candidatus Contendobacter odensis]|uniref:ABC transporter ATP-binding protein n=1 Tax=Candidatus Contendibacter odensensis TaxID=1400860 RepID=A0A2G6PG60_9GAMM|nr:MAG: ABC transporter ATP-binding protein [Candidatus Contendobacter odensis]